MERIPAADMRAIHVQGAAHDVSDQGADLGELWAMLPSARPLEGHTGASEPKVCRKEKQWSWHKNPKHSAECSVI